MTTEVIGTGCKASEDRGAWTCGLCGFRGFWSGGAHCTEVRALTIDDANTALAVASNIESRIAALRALVLAAEAEIERLQAKSPDWSCHPCRMTWAGGTAPRSLMCPDCNQMLTEERA